MTNVSLIIPCYNGAPYIENLCNCLNEVVTSSTEVIFVDDGSQDNSKLLFQKFYPNANIIIQKNKGLAAARNTGVTMAKGEYLQFLDVDDVIVKGKIPVQYEFAKKWNIDVVYSDWQMIIIKNNLTVEEPPTLNKLKDRPLYELLRGWWQPVHSYLIRRSCYIEAGGGDETLSFAEDFDLMVRIAINTDKFGYQPGLFSKYYRFENVLSLSRRSNEKFWEDAVRSILNNYKLMELKNINTVQLKSIIANRLFNIAKNVVKYDTACAIEIVNRAKEFSKKYYCDQKYLYKIIFRMLGFINTARLFSRKKYFT